MAEYRITGDIPETISRQHQEQQEDQHPYYHQHTEESISISRSSSSATSASTTATRVATGARARAYAREAEDEARIRAAMLRGQYVDCCDYYARSFHRAVPAGVQREFATRIKAGMSADVIRAAIDDTMCAPRPSWAYCAAILRNCDLDGVRTLRDWQERKMRYQSASNPALNYEQRTYNEDMFGEDFFIDLDKYGGGRDEG